MKVVVNLSRRCSDAVADRGKALRCGFLCEQHSVPSRTIRGPSRIQTIRANSPDNQRGANQQPGSSPLSKTPVRRVYFSFFPPPGQSSVRHHRGLPGWWKKGRRRREENEAPPLAVPRRVAGRRPSPAREPPSSADAEASRRQLTDEERGERRPRFRTAREIRTEAL